MTPQWFPPLLYSSKRLKQFSVTLLFRITVEKSGSDAERKKKKTEVTEWARGLLGWGSNDQTWTEGLRKDGFDRIKWIWGHPTKYLWGCNILSREHFESRKINGWVATGQPAERNMDSSSHSFFSNKCQMDRRFPCEEADSWMRIASHGLYDSSGSPQDTAPLCDPCRDWGMTVINTLPSLATSKRITLIQLRNIALKTRC